MPEQGDISAHITDNTILISKEFDASNVQVFSMFKNPVQLAKWWGPASWPATIVSFDFKPGGTWHYYMSGPDGTKAWGKATFQVIDEPHKLIFMDAFSDEAGTINPTLPEGKITCTFEGKEDKTILTMRAVYRSSHDAKKLVEMGAVEGLKETLSQLEKLLEEE